MDRPVHVAQFFERSVECLCSEHKADKKNDDDPLDARNVEIPSERNREDRAHDIEAKIEFLAPCDAEALEGIRKTSQFLIKHPRIILLLLHTGMFEILIASFLVMLVSLSGKLITWRQAGPFVERNLHFFVSSAAGVLLVVIYQLSSEIIEHAGSITTGLPWIVAGALVVLIAFRYLPHFHHHHDAGTGDHTHSRIDANRILLSDGIHNIGDGVVIVAAFAASPFLGVASTASIMLHEMLQEISQFFVLRQAGLSTRKALTYNFLVSSTILVGAVGGYFLLEKFEAFEVPLLGLAAGSYLIVVFHDLIPHSIDSVRERGHYFKHLLFFAVGITLMAVLVTLLPHSGN